jgi:hypothetical protein
MPKRTRIPHIDPGRVTPQKRPADLPVNYKDYTPAPRPVKDIRAKRPPVPDRPWTNTVLAPADDLD